MAPSSTPLRSCQGTTTLRRTGVALADRLAGKEERLGGRSHREDVKKKCESAGRENEKAWSKNIFFGVKQHEPSPCA